MNGGTGNVNGGTGTILHVDLDAFFASVEVRENPALRGRPVIVGADPRGGRGRGVVSAASYEARKYGVRSAVPISEAFRRCPDGVYLRPRIALYSEVSRRFMKVLGRYTDAVEPLSIDEAFLDVTGSRTLFGSGEEIGRRIKQEVRGEEGITASVGVAPSKFLAKIASDLDKPDGLVVVPPDAIGEFLADLPVERLWGAGPKAMSRFKRLGARTIGEVAGLSEEALVNTFGPSLGRHFHRLACGIDDRAVVPGHERKSVGRETTFAHDVGERSVVHGTLLGLVEEVAYRLRQKGLAGRVVTVKLRTADFVTVTRQEQLDLPADTTEQIWPVAQRLIARADGTGQPIRLVGVSLSSFAVAQQFSLFEEAATARHRKIASALDTVSERFGEGTVVRGAALAGKQGRR